MLKTTKKIFDMLINNRIIELSNLNSFYIFDDRQLLQAYL